MRRDRNDFGLQMNQFCFHQRGDTTCAQVWQNQSPFKCSSDPHLRLVGFDELIVGSYNYHLASQSCHSRGDRRLILSTCVRSYIYPSNFFAPLVFASQTLVLFFRSLLPFSRPIFCSRCVPVSRYTRRNMAARLLTWAKQWRIQGSDVPLFPVPLFFALLRSPLVRISTKGVPSRNWLSEYLIIMTR